MPRATCTEAMDAVIGVDSAASTAAAVIAISTGARPATKAESAPIDRGAERPALGQGAGGLRDGREGVRAPAGVEQDARDRAIAAGEGARADEAAPDHGGPGDDRVAVAAAGRRGRADPGSTSTSPPVTTRSTGTTSRVDLDARRAAARRAHPRRPRETAVAAAPRRGRQAPGPAPRARRPARRRREHGSDPRPLREHAMSGAR